jgi:uncharacterized hydrophobic protein (TIGR00341 family)
MALRLLEMVLPARLEGELDRAVEGLDVLDRWRSEVSDERLCVHLVLKREAVEQALDALQDWFGSVEGFRVVLLEVGVTLPALEEKNGSGPKGDLAAQPKEPAPEPTFGRVSRQELQSQLATALARGFEYPIFVVLSAVVAAIGLMRDNVAVVVAAMVIAPLLGPNMAFALATATGDAEMIRRALSAQPAREWRSPSSSSLAIGAATHVFGDSDALLLSSEILGRIEGLHPGDFVLALASGVAGTLSLTTGASSTLIGVMVAVALMPPLVCAGVLLGCGHVEQSGAAFLLLVTNVICVNLAAVGTLGALGVRPAAWWEAERARRATRLALVIWSTSMFALLGVTALRFVRL